MSNEANTNTETFNESFTRTLLELDKWIAMDWRTVEADDHATIMRKLMEEVGSQE